MQFVLLHSPALGPSSWSWVATSLVDAGHEVELPDMQAIAAAGDLDELVHAAAAAVPAGGSDPWLVGHSGFGPLLPTVAAWCGPVSPRLCFVDAGIPPLSGSADLGGDFLGQLRRLAVGGVLPAWSGWWGDGAMERLVPQTDRRVVLDAEMTRVPLELYEANFDVPAGWIETPSVYLQLSGAYASEAEKARELGWPCLELSGGHLDLVSRPQTVARVLEQLAGAS